MRGLPKAKEDPNIVVKESEPEEIKVKHEEMFDEKKEPNLKPDKKNKRTGINVPKEPKLFKEDKNNEDSDVEVEKEPIAVPDDKVLTKNGKLISKKQYQALEKARKIAHKNKMERNKAKRLKEKQEITEAATQVLNEEVTLSKIDDNDIERIATIVVRKEKERRSASKKKKNNIDKIKYDAKKELLEEQQKLLKSNERRSSVSVPKPPKKTLTASDLLHQNLTRPSYLFSNF